MNILQRLFAFFLCVFFTGFSIWSFPFRQFDAQFGSQFDEERFIAALNDKDVAYLESIMHRLMKEEHADLTQQLEEFMSQLHAVMEEPFVRGDFHEWGDSIIYDTIQRISDRIGYEYVKRNCLIGSGGGGSSSDGWEYWRYSLDFGDLQRRGQGGMFGDFYVYFDWTQTSRRDPKGITRLLLRQSVWTPDGQRESTEVLFEIEVDW